MTLAEIAPPTGQDVTVWKYIILGLFTVGGLAAAITAILKLGDRFRTPYATQAKFEELQNKVKWIEDNCDFTLRVKVEMLDDKIDAVQAAMTKAAEARADKVVDAVESLKQQLQRRQH